MLPVGMWNESGALTLCSPFFFLCTTCSSNRPVADAIGCPFSLSLVLVSLLLYLYVTIPPPSPRSIQNSNIFLQPASRYPASTFTLPPSPFFLLFFSSHLLSTTSQPSLLTRFKSRSRDRKPDFAKHSVDSLNQLDYASRISTTQSNYPSLSQSLARWNTHLFSLLLSSVSIFRCCADSVHKIRNVIVDSVNSRPRPVTLRALSRGRYCRWRGVMKGSGY